MALFFGILTVTLTLQVRGVPVTPGGGVGVELASGFTALGPLRGKRTLSADASGAVASPKASRL